MARDRQFRNALAYSLPELFWGFAWAVSIDSPMPAAFAKGFGGSESLVGAFALCIALGLGLPMLFTEYVIAPFKRKRTFLFWGHVAPAVLLILLAGWIHLMQGHDPAYVRAGYLLGIGLFFVAIGFQVPLWLGLVGDLFPHNRRARVLGIAFAFNRTGALAGGFLAEHVLGLDWYAHDQWELLFGVAGGLMLFGCIPFLFLVEEAREPRRRPPLREYFGILWRTWQALPALRRFVRADFLGCAAFIALMFYGDAAIREHGAHESWAGVWSRSYSGAQLVLAIVVAAVGARVTERRWLILGSIACAVGAVAAGLASEPVWFHVPACLLGVYMLIRMTCNGPEILRLAGGGDGTTPIAIAWFVVVPMQGLGPFIAGEALIPSFGYAPVFFAVACLAFVCALLWAFDRPRLPANGDLKP